MGVRLANAGISVDAISADIGERSVQKNSGLSATGEIAGLLARIVKKGSAMQIGIAGIPKCWLYKTQMVDKLLYE